MIVPTIAARATLLERCVDALDQQTLARDRFEVIVVPNGPGSASVGAVAGADRTLRIAEPGAAGARNAGAEASRAGTLVFLDDDILAAPDCLATHLERQREAAGVVLGPAYPAGPRGTLAAQASARWWLDHYSRKHRPGHRFTFVDCLTGNLGIPRELFLAAGGLDQAFGVHRREDWELGFRLLSGGASFRAAPEAIAHHHDAPDVARLLRDARREGYGDVLLAACHPAVRRDLRLARLGGELLRSRRWTAHTALGRTVSGERSAAMTSALAGLERARLRVRWASAFATLAEASYRAGVQSALDDGHRIPRGSFARTIIDLDSPAPLETGPALGEIVFLLGGEELGHVIAPDGQWDEEEIVRRAVDMAAVPALAAQARRAVA